MKTTRRKSLIPDGHHGASYGAVLADLSQKRDTRRYLEIGVNTGWAMGHVWADLAVGVDPSFSLECNVAQNKRRVLLHQMTSDAFFGDPAAVGSIGGSIDLAFLDGMHLFEYLLRDFLNTEAICHPGSLIAVHDCLPLNVEMMHRNFAHSVEIGMHTKYATYWTGDVWKLVPILRKYRKDLRLVFVDAPPTGLVLVTNLDPSSTVLRESYLDIVQEFAAIPNDREQIERLYAEIEIWPSDRITREHDHSLYFSV